jgi:hypothetical protein
MQPLPGTDTTTSDARDPPGSERGMIGGVGTSHTCKIPSPSANTMLTQLAPTQPIRSLRQGTQAHALRTARTCYDHLAGRLGVELMRVMIEREHLTGGDGALHPSQDRAA